jgi:hypothetical protein
MSRPVYTRGDVIRWRAPDGAIRVGVFRRWGATGRASIGVTKSESSSGWWIDAEQIVEEPPKRGGESGT